MARSFPDIPLPPQPPTLVKTSRLHGAEVIDEYAYFRDREYRDVQNYIEDEKAYAAAMMAPFESFQRELARAMLERTDQQDRSVPQRYRGYWYYSRWEVDRDYPLHCRRRGSLKGEEQVYLDENTLAAGRDYFDLVAMDLCPAQRYLAFAIDYDGEERYQIYFRDLSSDEMLHDVIADASGGFTWCEDGEHLFYVRLDESERPYAVFVHRLGDATTRDRCIFVEHDPAFHVDIWKSRSNHYLFVETSSHTTSEISFLPADQPQAIPQVIDPRRPGVEYEVDHQGDRFLILTSENTVNYKLMAAPIDAFSRENWTELVAEREHTVLCYADPYKDFVVIGEIHQGVDRIGLLYAGGITYLDCACVGASIDVEDLDNYSSRFVRVSVSSLSNRTQIWDYDVGLKTWTLQKTEFVAGYNADAYTCEQVSVNRSEGVSIPLTLAFKKTTRKGGPKPVLLYAYGAYGECLSTDFDSDLISLLDRGVVIAYAHVRGGGEFGKNWHDAGRLLNKQNGIDDFIDCARHLIDSGYAATGSIAAWGESAGGLLVAAAVQRTPQLFASVVTEVPFVDVLNTLMDKSLPITAADIEEFGEPSEPAQFEYIRTFSPYENVSGRFPPLLVTAGLNDQRVGYWEPLKWVARIRATKNDGNPVILKLDDIGHTGATGRFQQTMDTAYIYTFLLINWGLLP